MKNTRRILLVLLVVVSLALSVVIRLRRRDVMSAEAADTYIDYMRRNPPTCVSSLTYEAGAVLRERLLKDYGSYSSVFGIRCGCGNRNVGMEGKEVNTYAGIAGPIAIACDGCAGRNVIFDPARHGGDAELGYGYSNRELGDKKLKCPGCSEPVFEVAVAFQYSGDEDEVIREGGLEKKREDLFGWFAVRVVCKSCGRDFEATSIECQ